MYYVFTVQYYYCFGCIGRPTKKLKLFADSPYVPAPAIGMLNLYAGMPDIVVGFFFSSNIFRMILSAAKEREKDGAVNIG